MVVVPLYDDFVMVVVVVMGLRLRGTMHIDMIMIALDDDLLLIVVMMMVRLWRPVDVDVLVAALHNYFVVVMPVMRGRSVHADVIVVALDDDLVVMIVRRAAFQSPEADIGIVIGIVDTDMNVRGGNHYPSVRRAPSEARGKDRPVHIDVVVVTLNYNLVMVVVVSPALSAFRTGLIANADRTELEEWVQGIPGVGSLVLARLCVLTVRIPILHRALGDLTCRLYWGKRDGRLWVTLRLVVRSIAAAA